MCSSRSRSRRAARSTPRLPEQEALATSIIEEAKVQIGRRVSGHWEKVRAGQTGRRIIDEARAMQAGAIVMPMARGRGRLRPHARDGAQGATVPRDHRVDAVEATRLAAIARGRHSHELATDETDATARGIAFTVVEVIAAIGLATAAVALLQSAAPGGRARGHLPARRAGDRDPPRRDPGARDRACSAC